MIDFVCGEVRALLDRGGASEHVFVVELLLRELLNNAILHGNLSVPEKRVRVTVRVGRRWIVLRIGDEGAGFDWREMKLRIPDETVASGRGLTIAALYSERMWFNRAGNEIALWIRKTKGRETTG